MEGDCGSANDIMAGAGDEGGRGEGGAGAGVTTKRPPSAQESPGNRAKKKKKAPTGLVSVPL